MPRDSELLNPTSRALLRAARAGCIYIRHAPKERVEETKVAVSDGEESTAIRTADRSFTALKWTAVPKHLEPPEVEFLAKRRPGLPSLYGGAAPGAVGSGDNGVVSMRRTRFKKVDSTTGNISVYEAWVPEGLKIEGETTEDTHAIISANSGVTVTPEVPSPGTVVEGVGVVNSEGVVVAETGAAAVVNPLKRRPPPPKRKGKGIGRGRRKKVMFAPGEGGDASIVHGGEAGAAEGTAATGIGKEGADASQLSVDQSGQEEEEEEEEGEEGEESDDGDESMVDTKTPETPVQQGTEETPDIKPEPAAEPGPVSDAPAEAPSTETPLQPHPPEVSSQAPSDTPSAAHEEKQSDEKIAAEDVDMTDSGQVTETPQVPKATATTPENAPQSPPKEATQSEPTVEPAVQEAAPDDPSQKPSETTAESELAQTPDQSAMPTGGTAVDNDTEAGNGDAAPENAADGDQPGLQIEEQPATSQAENEENEAEKDSEDQTDGHIEEPIEQAGEQSIQGEPKSAVPEESTETDEQQQSTEQSIDHPTTQPPDQAQDKSEEPAEEQPAGEQAAKHEEEDLTPLPLQQSADPAPAATTENQPKPEEAAAGHEGKIEDVKQEEEGESAPSG